MLKKKKIEDRKKSAPSLPIEQGHYGIPEQSSWVKQWAFMLEGTVYYIKFHLGTLTVNCNGRELDTINDFGDDGGRIDFLLGSHKARIRTRSSGVRKEGMYHILIVNGEIVPE